MPSRTATASYTTGSFGCTWNSTLFSKRVPATANANNRKTICFHVPRSVDRG
jgi:hypothetical protein